MSNPRLKKPSRSKSRKGLQSLVTQIDALFSSLADKPAKQADLLIEKSGVLNRIAIIEKEELESEQTARVAELEAGQKVSAARISELEQRNRELQVKASTPQILTVSDPNHAVVKDERDALQSIVALLTATMSGDTRAETAARIYQTSPLTAEAFCRLVHVDYGVLSRLMHFTEPELKRLEVAPDYSNVALARGVLHVKFAPAKPQAPAFIPDTRSADEKLRDAKAQTRQSWQ